MNLFVYISQLWSCCISQLAKQEVICWLLLIFHSFTDCVCFKNTMEKISVGEIWLNVIHAELNPCTKARPVGCFIPSGFASNDKMLNIKPHGSQLLFVHCWRVLAHGRASGWKTIARPAIMPVEHSSMSGSWSDSIYGISIQSYAGKQEKVWSLLII